MTSAMKAFILLAIFAVPMTFAGTAVCSYAAQKDCKEGEKCVVHENRNKCVPKVQCSDSVNQNCKKRYGTNHTCVKIGDTYKCVEVQCSASAVKRCKESSRSNRMCVKIGVTYQCVQVQCSAVIQNCKESSRSNHMCVKIGVTYQCVEASGQQGSYVVTVGKSKDGKTNSGTQKASGQHGSYVYTVGKSKDGKPNPGTHKASGKRGSYLFTVGQHKPSSKDISQGGKLKPGNQKGGSG